MPRGHSCSGAAFARRALTAALSLQDASRLVFVSVKDAKPKRKVAVPIGDSTTWEQFCGQVLRSVHLPLSTPLHCLPSSWQPHAAPVAPAAPHFLPAPTSPVPPCRSRPS
jgi:hypothetical protein